MHWHQLLSTERYGHTAPQELGRSHFHKDHDRIVFSSAFRRLSGKTQVHPLSLNDHVHTRLIHSVEVGSVGRSLGLRVGERIANQLPPWCQPDDLGVIVQAACLAHDIGNPPFGHAGEYAIQDWFRRQTHWLAPLSAAEQDDFKHWEGNAQGFRLVAQVEQHLMGGGLRLTFPTLASMLKYPWTVTHRTAKGKFACFQSEAHLLNTVAEQLGLTQATPHLWRRHPLSYLMEAADDICYAIIDLEDAVELNILEFAEVRDVLCRINPDAEAGVAQDERHSPLRQLGALRGKAMQVIIDAVTEAFIEHHDVILSGSLQGDLLSHCPEPVVAGIAEAKSIAQRKIFKDRRKTEIEIGAYGTLSTLLEAFIHAGYELHQSGEHLSYRSQRIIDLMQHEAPNAEQPLYAIYQRMLDFITRQTDQYATALARQISGAAP